MEERNQRDFNLTKGRFLGFGGIEGGDEKKKIYPTTRTEETLEKEAFVKRGWHCLSLPSTYVARALLYGGVHGPGRPLYAWVGLKIRPD